MAAAVVESVAENASDSLVAPLVFFVVGGVPGAIAYRACNTLDSMIGYRGETEWLGKAAARLDDAGQPGAGAPDRGAASSSPARWSAPRRAGALRVWWRDGARTESPNAGRPMAAMAGALGVELEKVGCYRLGEGAARRRCGGDRPRRDAPVRRLRAHGGRRRGRDLLGARAWLSRAANSPSSRPAVHGGDAPAGVRRLLDRRLAAAAAAVGDGGVARRRRDALSAPDGAAAAPRRSPRATALGADEVVVGAGSVELIWALARAFGGPGGASAGWRRRSANTRRRRAPRAPRPWPSPSAPRCDLSVRGAPGQSDPGGAVDRGRRAPACVVVDEAYQPLCDGVRGDGAVGAAWRCCAR